MLSAEGCRQRRQRFLAAIGRHLESGLLQLADPIHLMYLANFHVNPFSLGGGFGGLLRLEANGRAILFHDNRLPQSVQETHVDERHEVNWYDGESAPQVPRQLAVVDALRTAGEATRVHDRPEDPLGPIIIETLAGLRRRKDADEIALLRRCMAATEAGHVWARQNIRPGMTELDVYRGVASACAEQAQKAVIVYGDFAVSPGPERHGGPPTQDVLKSGDMFILDFSVVMGGYRSDFTNTLAVGGEPSAAQRRMYELCTTAMAAGEKELAAGNQCLTVYQAVNDVFEKAGVGEHFPHHAGHGLGLTHPEAPFFVPRATETLVEGDVVTLEPGLYLPGVGGMRIEHNYLITAEGYERLSDHAISLT